MAHLQQSSSITNVQSDHNYFKKDEQLQYCIELDHSYVRKTNLTLPQTDIIKNTHQKCKNNMKNIKTNNCSECKPTYKNKGAGSKPSSIYREAKNIKGCGCELVEDSNINSKTNHSNDKIQLFDLNKLNESSVTTINNDQYKVVDVPGLFLQLYQLSN